VYSHTDNKGSDVYNLKLSQQRAESVVNYLTSKSFNRNRFKAIGYGETLPLLPNENPDKSDNPSNRQVNRRTEFKIVGKIDPNSIEYNFEGAK
jgi:outer membrane protein OmpA-like peptidoglycan-associated protein